MNALRTLLARRQNLSKLVAVAAAGLAIGLGSTAMSLSANADSVPIKETTCYNCSTIHWNTGRTNTHARNEIQFQFKSWTPGTGGYIRLGARNGSGTQFAATNDMTTFKTYTFYNSSGSYSLPSGTFYLNSNVTGGCGGSGCGDQTWGGTLLWNIALP